MTCKQGENIGLDSQQRVQYCTTAREVDVAGLPVAAKSYTLFHPSGKIYQTHAPKKFERVLKIVRRSRAASMSCQSPTTARCSTARSARRTRCRPGVGGAKAGGVKASVGDGIAFHPGGDFAGLTVDEPYTSS